jgi:hypothetical protein
MECMGWLVIKEKVVLSKNGVVKSKNGVYEGNNGRQWERACAGSDLFLLAFLFLQLSCG